jgi:S-adenosylmethionine hydrolase
MDINDSNNKIKISDELIKNKWISSIEDLEFTCNKKIEELDEKINDLKNEIRILNKKLNNQARSLNFKIPSNYNKEVKGEVWQVTLIDNYGDISKNVYNKVFELYIPDWNVTFNITFRELNTIVHAKRRYNLNNCKLRPNPNNSKFIKEIILDYKLTYELYNIVKLQNDLDKLKISSLEKIRNIFKL